MGWLADGVNHSSNRFERQYEDIANALDPTRRATHGSPVTVRALFPFSAIFKVDLFWLAWSLSCHLLPVLVIVAMMFTRCCTR